MPLYDRRLSTEVFNSAESLKIYYLFLYITTEGNLRHGAIRGVKIEFIVYKRTMMRILDRTNRSGQKCDVTVEIIRN